MSERVEQEVEIKLSQHSCVFLLSQEQHFLNWNRIKAHQGKKKSEPNEN